MMDCDTTGIEPDLALVKYKKLVGGGVIKIVNNTVPSALIRLGYAPEQVEEDRPATSTQTGTIEGAPAASSRSTSRSSIAASRPQNGQRFIHHMGHIRMMAAVQPFISGAISKTINMPEESTADDIIRGLRRELEARPEGGGHLPRRLQARPAAQLRQRGKGEKKSNAALPSPRRPPAVLRASKSASSIRPQRRKLPDERQSITHKFSIAGHEGYITVGLFEDGTPGELFITMAKEGSTISGLMDSFATAVSYALQYGVPLKFFVDKFSHVRFEPSGYTGNAAGRLTPNPSWITSSVGWRSSTSAPITSKMKLETSSRKCVPLKPAPQQKLQFSPAEGMDDAPACSECGGLMTRNGSCYKCENCGGTSGCS